MFRIFTFLCFACTELLAMNTVPNYSYNLMCDAQKMAELSESSDNEIAEPTKRALKDENDDPWFENFTVFAMALGVEKDQIYDEYGVSKKAREIILQKKDHEIAEAMKSFLKK